MKWRLLWYYTTRFRFLQVTNQIADLRCAVVLGTIEILALSLQAIEVVGCQ